ncbi:hypothetical protein OUZ56_008760 [Daphnia magna]|uniref:Uncharacterized protein n=1 Tax=Daphnia magna TaxID=35525 RepID=A0ABR0ADZ2_9CRUS|nr:hypothetical protein OUZ56_008760 [Daphnia magna]
MKKIKHESHQCQFSVMLLSRFQEELKEPQLTTKNKTRKEFQGPNRTVTNIVFEELKHMKSVKSDSSENTGWYSPVRKHVKLSSSSPWPNISTSTFQDF